jgi:aryl-alcohol dehydrogenase-like predicted oxidoreductase
MVRITVRPSSLAQYRTEASRSLHGLVREYGVARRVRRFRSVSEKRRIAELTFEPEASVALAWLLARPRITAPITSATNEKQLADLAAATKLNLDGTLTVERVGGHDGAFQRQQFR